AAYDVCDAPKDCHQLSEEELGNVDIEGFAGALPACILGCVGTAGIDVLGLVATEELPECQPMCKLVTCAVDACGQGDIDRTQFCLLQDVLGNTCQEDFDAGVTYGRGSVPIVDLFDTVDCPVPGTEECFTAFLSDTYGDGWNSNVLTIENEDTGAAINCMQCEFGKCEAGLTSYMKGSSSEYLFVISFLLPTTTTMIFSTFPCLELDTGERWLLADKSIDCDGAAHVVMVAYAWVMVVVFCVGVPGGCFLLLWRQRDKIKVSEVERKADESLGSIRSLFENYKPECWYWEPLEMLRRIFMTGFLVVLARGSYAQIQFCLL
ncbi:hypothetical protein TeGR_g10287, partial [Tetraparma gracilis]